MCLLFLAHVYWTPLFGCLGGLRPNTITVIHFLPPVFPISMSRDPRKAPLDILNISKLLCHDILEYLLGLCQPQRFPALSISSVAVSSVSYGHNNAICCRTQYHSGIQTKASHSPLRFVGGSWACSASGCTAGVALFHLFPIFLLGPACWLRQCCSRGKRRGTRKQMESLTISSAGLQVAPQSLLHTRQ